MAVTLDELLDSNQPGLGDPMLSDKWRIVALPTIGGVSLSPLACEELDLPFPVYQETSKQIATVEVYFPKGTSLSGFSATFGLDHKAAVLRYADAWANLIQNPYTGGFRLPGVYKKNIEVALFDTKGTKVVTAVIRNCWPLGLSNLSLNGTGSRLMPVLQFQCDTQRLIF